MKSTIELMTEAAERYAQADKSDPFARDRALSHLQNGVASLHSIGEENPGPGYYDATLAIENGRQTYTNRARP